MASSCRTSSGKLVDLITIHRPFSNFDFIDQQFDGLPSLRRIMSQVRQNQGETMVIEELDLHDARDLCEENEDIRRRYGALSSSSAYRLTFFSKPIQERRHIDGLENADFVGYAVVKRDDVASGRRIKTRIYESVVRPSRHVNNYIRRAQEWKCSPLGTEFSVQGYIYAQQNAMTNVCAHAALRATAASFHQQGDMSYREMNDLLGIDHVSRKVGGPDGGGLTQYEMAEVLRAAGAKCILIDYTDADDADTSPPFQKWLYGSIESGFPAIVCFAALSPGGERSYHAIPLFGHTFNEDAWVANADRIYFRPGNRSEFIPSESWLSAYIGHDDNCGSNFCIPRNYLYTRQPCRQLPGGPGLCPEETECVAYVLPTLPANVQVDAIEAEAIAADYLGPTLDQLPSYSDVWQDRLRLYKGQSQLILRPLLLDITEYAGHISRISDWDGRQIRRDLVEILREMPGERIWMIELSIPELFSANRRKVAEIVIRADKVPNHPRDIECFVLARLPGCFAIPVAGDASEFRLQFVPSGTSGHVEHYGCEE